MNKKPLIEQREKTQTPFLMAGMGTLFLALTIVSLFLPGCTKPASNPVDKSRIPTSSGGYVGSEACRECHEGVYRGWQTTFHAQKFQKASSDFIIGDFVRKNTIGSGSGAMKMERQGEGSQASFWVSMAGADGQPARHQVEYVIGSIWKQVYITRLPNGAMQVLPVQWNVLERQWSAYNGPGEDHPRGAAWSEEGEMFQYKCMGCHTTNSKVEFDQTSKTYKTTWQEMGVGCEACHGPGEAHIKSDLIDKFDTIFNPPRMPDPSRAAMVCGSCHDVGLSPDGQYSYPVSYRPGDRLDFHLHKDDRVYPDGSPKTHHQQYNDWLASDHARAGVMCWDCHSVHVRGKFNRYQLKMPGSLLCMTCHRTVALKGAHSLHSTNNCISCHMPNTIKSATKGDLRSHRMSVVRPEWTVKQGGDQDEQPNSCNLCHYHKDYDPEKLAHFLRSVRKPEVCGECHHHKEEDPEDFDPF